MNNKITLAFSLFFLIAISFSGFSQSYNLYQSASGSVSAYEDGTSVSQKQFSTSSGHTGLTFEFTQSPAGRLSLPDIFVPASSSTSSIFVPIIALDNYIDDGDQNVTVTVTVVNPSDANYIGQYFTFIVNVYDNDSHGITFTDLNNIGSAIIGDNIVDTNNDGFDDAFPANVGVVLTTTPDQLDPLYLKITDDDGIFQMVPFLFNSPGASVVPGSGMIFETGSTVKALVRSEATLIEVFEQKNVTLVNENGNINDNVYIALSTEPTDNVTLAISVNDGSELSVSTTSLSFTPSNWYVPQILTATGVSDTENDGSVISQINITSSSSDTQYNSYNYTYTNVTTECVSFPCVEFTSSQYQTIQVSENPSIDGILNTQPDPRENDFKHLINTLHNVIYYNKNRKIIYNSNSNSSSSPYPAYLTAVNPFHYNNFGYELVTNEIGPREITLNGVSSFGYWTEKQNYEDNNPTYTYTIKVVYTDLDDSENNTFSTSDNSTITLIDETSEYDYDGDGIPYDLDQCPDTPSSNPNYQSSSLITDTSSPDCGCADSDGDAIFDSYELFPSKYNIAPIPPTTDPYDPDSDDDGLTDGEEINTHNTDPNDSDSDDDGLTDGAEINTHITDPNDSDSDDDTYSDGDEVSVNTDPNNQLDSPANAAPNAPTNLYIGFSSNFSAYIISGSVGVGATSVTITFPDNTTQNVTPTNNQFSYTSSTDFSSGNYLFIASNNSGASLAETQPYNSACEDSPHLFTLWDGDESIDNGQTSVFASNGYPVGPFSTNATIISCYDYSLFQITTITLQGLGDVDVLAFSSPAVYNSGGNNFKKVLIYDPAFAPPGSNPNQASEQYFEITVEIKSTAPDEPIVTTANGTTVTGTAEAGSTVKVYASDGTVLGTAIADGSGDYTVTLSPAQSNGAAITVTATDANGNESTAAATTVDAAAPAAPVITWTGTTSTDWNTTSNWNPQFVPTSTYSINIPSTGITNFPVATSLTIDAGKTVTLNSNARLTVNGTITNNGTLTLESGATLVQEASSTLAGTGTYNVKQTVTGAGGATATGRFWYMGVPLNSLTRGAAFGNDGADNRLWSWSESSQAWSTPISNATTLTPTTGYVFRTGATSTTLNFSGTSLYSADASITGLTNSTGSFDGCHLMSNPYTAYLDWEAVIAAAGTTNLSSTYCVRSYNSTNSEMVYDTYNATGDVSVNPSGVAMTRYIAPMQAFWITVDPSTTGTLSMTKAMLSHQAGAVGLKDITSFPAFARLNLVSGNFYDQVVVYTDANANAELEDYDSKKFFLPNKAQVYCPVGNEKLVINALKQGKAQTSAPLTVELPSTQVYKFEMAESFVENGLVILEDKQEGIFQDMGVNPIYEFFGNSGVIADRFVLHFQLPNGTNNEGQAGIEDLTSGQIAVIANHDGAITVALSADLTTSGDIQIFDGAGRLVAQKAITSAQTSLQLSNGIGVYFVRVQTPMKTEMKKVMVY